MPLHSGKEPLERGNGMAHHAAQNPKVDLGPRQNRPRMDGGSATKPLGGPRGGGRMSRKAKIDQFGIGDQVLLWATTMDARTIARKFRESTGTTISHVAIVNWLQKQREPRQEKALVRQESITTVTKELLEGEWGRTLVEIREAYMKAKLEEDTRTAGEWMTKWQRHIEMILKLYRPPDTQITVDARQAEGGLKERLWKALNE